MQPSGTFIRFIFRAGLGDPAQRGNLFYIWIYYRSSATAAERGVNAAELVIFFLTIDVIQFQLL